MGSSPQPEAVPPEFLRVFRSHADANGAMPFERFMALALYDPAVGYYRQERTRVGYAPGSDFFTASSSGPLFGELVCAACVTLLHGRDPHTHTFVEIGAESAGGVLAGVEHPFAGVRTLRVGEPLAITGDCVVFSNELFDAQPCASTVTRRGEWREVGVRLSGDRLVEIELPLRAMLADTPPAAGDGYRFDQPRAATALAETIAQQPWSGVFVAIDYGKSLRELLHETPAGTVRAYYRHQQSNDVLARPGQQDLTCHVCWDWLEAALQRNGFGQVQVDFQESFFVRHAGEFLARVTASEASRLSARKLALLQLLHPTHLGQKFQVLHAVR